MNDRLSTKMLGHCYETSERQLCLHSLVREVVGASSNRSHACGLKGRGQELDVLLLVRGDVLEVVVVIRRVACFLEVSQAEFLEGLLVEDVLEVLKL